MSLAEQSTSFNGVVSIFGPAGELIDDELCVYLEGRCFDPDVVIKRIIKTLFQSK